MDMGTYPFWDMDMDMASLVEIKSEGDLVWAALVVVISIVLSSAAISRDVDRL